MSSKRQIKIPDDTDYVKTNPVVRKKLEDSAKARLYGMHEPMFI